MSSKKKKGMAPSAEPVTHETPIASSAPASPGGPGLFDRLGNKGVYVAMGILLLMVVLVFGSYLSGTNVYIFKDIGSDTYNYNYPYVYHMADYIAKHGVPSWSFDHGMGQSLYPFFLREPFFAMFYLMGKDSILHGMIFNEVLKIMLGGFVFYHYLKTMKFSVYACIVGTVMFAFCGFIVVGGGWYIFSFEALNMALLLLAFERLLAGRGWYLFPLPIFLLSMSMPFNVYVYGLCLAIYAIARLFQEDRLNLKDGGLLFLKMAGLGLIGVLLSGPFLVENIVQILESPRGSGENSYSSILSSAPMFHTVDKVLAGTTVTRFFANDMLGTANTFKGWQNSLEAPLLYCGIPCLLLMPQVFPFLGKRVRIFFLSLLVALLLPLIFPWFRFAFWLFTGDYYRSYCLLISLFFIFYSLMALEKIFELKKINLPILLGTIAFCFLLLNYPFFEDKDVINSPIYTFACFMLLVYGALLFLAGRPNSPAYLKYVFLTALVLEMTYMSHTSANDREPITYEELQEKKGYNDYTMDALDHIRKTDKSFWRVDKTYASSVAMHFSLNDGMGQDYKGTSAYSPFNQLYYVRYLQMMGISDKKDELQSRWANGLMNRTILESENRVKYLLVKDYVPPMWRPISDSIGKFGDVTIFRSKLVMPFGYTYDKYIRESVFDKFQPNQKDLTTLMACVVKDEDVSQLAGMTEFNLADTIPPGGFMLATYATRVAELSRDSLVTTKLEETAISGKINLPSNKMLYLTIPYDAGWQLKVDGKPAEKKILCGGMTGVFLTAGQHTVDLEYHVRYIGKGMILLVIGLLAYAGLWFVTSRKKQTSNSIS